MVAVTGATGFLASHVVANLLEKGCKVIGTVRNIKDGGRYWPLLKLKQAPDMLQLVEADLSNEEGFVKAFEGVDCVVHAASPFFTRVEDDADAEARLLTPACKGTEHVLNACKKAGVKRVVVTSSIAAMYRQRPQEGFVSGVPPSLDADTWSDVEYMRESKQWYPLSKTLAEKAAWALADSLGLDVRVCNPSLILGPTFTPHMNESLKTIRALLDGRRKEMKNYVVGLVDVRDAAEAHYLLLAKDEAKGRHLCLGQFVDFLTVREEVAKVVGYSREVAEVVGGPKQVPAFDVSQLTKLGMTYRPLRECLEDTAQGLVTMGHLR